MLTWDFISGEMKYFHFGVCSISYNCLHDPTRNETHCGWYFIAVILKEMKFHSGHKTPYKHYPKWNHMKGNICTCGNKIDWLFLNEVFILDHPRNELHFISPSIKSNVNRISFRVGWNFNSGRFHFGYLVNILYLINQKLHIILKILLNH